MQIRGDLLDITGEIYYNKVDILYKFERNWRVKFNSTVYQTFSLIGQFGINMLVPILLCSFLGIFLDKKLGTEFLVFVMFFVGAIAGGYNVYRFSKRHMKTNDPNSAYMHGVKETQPDDAEQREDDEA